MDAVTYYYTIAQFWLYPAIAIVSTVLMFHYNGIIFFRWLAVAFWAMVAYFYWSTGNVYNILPLKLIGIVGLGAGIVMAVVPTLGKHVDTDVQAGNATAEEDAGHINNYLKRLKGREERITAIRRLGRKRVAPRTGGAVWDQEA